MVQFAHLFLLSFFSSWHSLNSFVRWTPKKVLIGETRPIQNWRVMVMPLSQDILSKNDSTLPLTYLDASLVSTNECYDPPTNLNSYETTIAYVPLCPHEEALRGSVFLCSETGMKNFIPQSILFLNKTEGGNCSSLKSSDITNNSVKRRKELFTSFHAACIQNFNTRKQHY